MHPITTEPEHEECPVLNVYIQSAAGPETRAAPRAERAQKHQGQFDITNKDGVGSTVLDTLFGPTEREMYFLLQIETV